VFLDAKDNDSNQGETPEDYEISYDSHGARKNWPIVTCPHKSRKHYAKNMCINCYHRRGRTKKAWACPHSEKLHYSKGLCQNCYLSRYYRQRKEQKRRRDQELARLRGDADLNELAENESEIDEEKPFKVETKLQILSNTFLGKRRHPEIESVSSHLSDDKRDTVRN